MPNFARASLRVRDNLRSAKKAMALGRSREARSSIVAAARAANVGLRFGGYGTIGKQRRRIKQEVKFKDLASANYVANTTGSVTLIPDAIAQGAGESARIGREIWLKSVEVRGMVASDSTTTIASVRILLVWDRQPNKALAAVTDILNSAHPDSFLNDQNKARFKVIRNWWFVCEGNNATAGQQTGKTAHDFNHFIKFKKPKKVTYSTAGTGAIGDLNTGALLLVVVGNKAAGTDDAALTAGFRTRFFD